MAVPSANGSRSPFREALDYATEFIDFLDALADIKVDGPDLLEILDAERHGGGYCPEEAHPME